MAGAERDRLLTRAFATFYRTLVAGGVELPPGVLVTSFRRFVMRDSSRRLLAVAGLMPPARARLFRPDAAADRVEAAAGGDAALCDVLDEWWTLDTRGEPAAPELLGTRFEALLGHALAREGGEPVLVAARGRKRTGSFYTPKALASAVVQTALERLAELGRADASDLAICDPACGAGAFLLEVARQLEARRRAVAASRNLPFDAADERRRLVASSLYGVDIEPLALEVTEIALFAFAGVANGELGRLAAGDALSGPGFDGTAAGGKGVDFGARFPELRPRGFDLVVGNPPWIAYAGRAAKPLSPARRQALRRAYEAFRGYPTLHAAFVERACRLAPCGVVALVVPSPVADLDGYRPLRRAVARTHVPCEPMLEFGQDAFAEVTQPCFALIARPLARGEVPVPERPFRLLERARSRVEARALQPPRVLERLAAAERLPRELFGEMGFQTTRAVSQRLLRRADAPDAQHTYPLLEGRVVREFVVGRPALFLRPDAELLRRERCRLRPLEEYGRARFVIRQTAKVPIAALNPAGLPFRNTLLAGFSNPEFPPEFLVGLLNSVLYRALHVAGQRDARQAAFPQVKVAHLRALPRPPADRDQAPVRELVELATREGPMPGLLRRLDEAVFDLFELSPEERQTIRTFVERRVPELERRFV